MFGAFVPKSQLSEHRMKIAQPKTQMTPRPAPVTQASAEVVPAIVSLSIRALYGDMRDPYTGEVYGTVARMLDAKPSPGSWLDAQIAAGKLELC